MTTQPTTANFLTVEQIKSFANYDIKTLEFGVSYITVTEKKHIKALFVAGLMIAKANRKNYSITKSGNEFTAVITSGNDKTTVKFSLVGYSEQPELEELPLTPKELSVCTWTENADSAKTDGTTVFFYCGGLLMEGLEMSVEEAQISIDAMYEIEAEQKQVKTLEVGQVIQGENCHLIVTKIAEPRNESDIELIYNDTHKDFKGIVDNQMYVVYNDNSTVYGPITTMPKRIFDEKLRRAKNNLNTPDIEYTWSYGGDWYITTDLVLKGRGIKLSNDGSDHKRGKRTYHVTDLAMKTLKSKYNCQYVNK